METWGRNEVDTGTKFRDSKRNSHTATQLTMTCFVEVVHKSLWADEVPSGDVATAPVPVTTKQLLQVNMHPSKRDSDAT